MTNLKNCSNRIDRFLPQFGALLLVLVVSSQSTFAGQVLDSHVSKYNDHYLLRIDMLIDANAVRVRQLLTDYAHLDRLSHSITQSELLASNAPHFQVRVTAQGCILFFCRKLVQVQDITELHDGYILVTVRPEMSDFSFGKNMWRIRALDDRTRVTYSSDLVPKVWIPPLIGTSIFKNQLLKKTRQLIDNLEQLANLPHDTVKQ